MSSIKAIINTRVSTSEQLLNNSLTRQAESVERAASKLGAIIPADGRWSGSVSSKAGKNVSRKDLLEMLAYCKQNKAVKYAIFDEYDRYMRSVNEGPYFEVLFQQLGVKVWYASESDAFNGDDAMAKFMRTMSAYKAEGSNEERQRKSISGHVAALRQGRYTFPPKPGFMKGAEPGIHIPNPEEFPYLQEAFNDVLSGLYTPSEALKRLNSSAFTTNRSPLKIDKFVRYLADPYYAGIVEIRKQINERNENGKHERMITVGQHEKLVEIVSGRKKPKYERSTHNPDFPLNKTDCYDCEGRLVGFQHTNGKGWKKPKYRCRGCGKQYHRDEIHAALDNVLRPLGIDDSSRDGLIEALNEVFEVKQRDSLKEVASLNGQRASLKNSKHSLTIELASNPSRRRDIEEALDTVNDQIDELDKKIAQASDYQRELVEFVAFALKFTQTLQDSWWTLSHENRLRCKQLLFPEGFSVGHDRKVYTPQISPLYRLATTKKNLDVARDSLLVELRGIAPRSGSLLSTHLQA